MREPNWTGGCDNASAELARGVGGRRTVGGSLTFHGEEIGASGGAQAAVRGFPEAKEQERDDGGYSQGFGPGADFGFRFPAEKLLAQEESQGRADRKRDDFRDDLRDTDAGHHDAFEAGNEIGGRKEEREALDPYR